MSEKKWYQRKSEIFWAAIFAFVALGFDKLLHVILEYYPALPLWINDTLRFTILVLPWIAVFIFAYLWFKWKNKARKLSEISSQSKWEGIEQTTGLERYIKRLEGSGHHPRELLDKIDLKLDFMGHGASKWTANREKLEKMLKRIAFNAGRARFLVINPLQTGLEPERAKKIALSLRTLWELKRAYANLDVKLYNHIPQLRMTFYDDNLVVVGHYQGLERQDSSNTPLLVFLRKCDWSFYKAFLSHFDEEWSRAVELIDIDFAQIEALARG
jgi:hypothetical protein